MRLFCRKWSGRQDSNLRPPGPKPGALPACATPRDFSILGDPDRIRTCDLLLRRQLLYPAELRGLFLYRRCKNTTNFLEYIHFWNICVAQYIYDYFHQKENINSFFLQILREIKFVRGLFFPSASNRKTHLIVI